MIIKGTDIHLSRENFRGCFKFLFCTIHYNEELKSIRQ
jgi:hypothetical protein